MTLHLSHVQVVPFFEERDEDGEVVTPAAPLQSGDQTVVLVVGAAEWKRGWNWAAAFDKLLGQLDPQSNGKVPAVEAADQVRHLT